MKAWKKALAFLMCLALLTGAAPLAVFADYDEDNLKCFVCGEWTDDYCEECLDLWDDRECMCNSCHDGAFCDECGGCLFLVEDDPESNACSDHTQEGICCECAADMGYHCADCGECLWGLDDELCEECRKCSVCADLCLSCGYCDECVPHCPVCGECDYLEEHACPSGGEEHCENECELCDECGECMYEMDEEPCEYCGLCPQCCEDLGCEFCGMCALDPEFEDHRCPVCDGCFESGVKPCDTCGYCVECCLEAAFNMGCECGLYCHEKLDATHICADCGTCFGVAEPCETCGAAGEWRCAECCRETSAALGCDCEPYVCVNDPGWAQHIEDAHGGVQPEHAARPRTAWAADPSDHWHDCRFCDQASHRSAKSGHTYNASGVCTVCGHVDGANIYITKQPVSRVVSIGDVLRDEEVIVPLSVCAKADKALTYQWEECWFPDFSQIVSDSDSDGADTPDLEFRLPTDGCNAYTGPEQNEIYIRCRISDGEHTVYSDIVTIRMKHRFTQVGNVRAGNGNIVKRGKITPEGHRFQCCGDCKAMGPLLPHSFGAWEWNDDRTVRHATCEVCGYQKTYHSHRHAISYDWSKKLRDVGNQQLNGSDEGLTIDEYDYVIGYSSPTYRYHIEWHDSDGRHYTIDPSGHKGTCDGEDGCEIEIWSPHDWEIVYVGLAPTRKGETSGFRRICRICGLEDDRVQFDANGEELLWEIGTHPFRVIGGRSESATTATNIVREGQSITLIPDQIEDKTFVGWAIEYDKLLKYTSTSDDKPEKDHRAFIVRRTDTDQIKKQNGFSADLSTYTIHNWGADPRFIADAEAWSFRALYEDGCDHSRKTLANAVDATCTAGGYTGDTVCAECGKTIARGEESLPTGHTDLYTLVKDEVIYQRDRKGNVVTDKRGNKLVVARGPVDGTCDKHGYSGDVLCRACGKVAEKGGYTSYVHRWEPTGRVTREATTTVRGLEEFKCAICGAVKVMPTGYTGDDCRVSASKTKIRYAFNMDDPDFDVVTVELFPVGRCVDQWIGVVGIPEVVSASSDAVRDFNGGRWLSGCNLAVRTVDGVPHTMITIPPMIRTSLYEFMGNYRETVIAGGDRFYTETIRVNWRFANSEPGGEDHVGYTDIVVEYDPFSGGEEHALTVENGIIAAADGADVSSQALSSLDLFSAAPVTLRPEDPGDFAGWAIVDCDYYIPASALEADADGAITLLMPGADLTIRALKKGELPPGGLRGDADLDGKVLAKDARLVLRASAKLETLEGMAFTNCDLNGDGKLLAGEARKILRYSAKLETEI